jgi:hypothetical protein
MSLVEQFPYHDRNPATPGFDLMPDLPILLRSPPHTVSGLALIDSGATITQSSIANVTGERGCVSAPRCPRGAYATPLAMWWHF